MHLYLKDALRLFLDIHAVHADLIVLIDFCIRLHALKVTPAVQPNQPLCPACNMHITGLRTFILVVVGVGNKSIVVVQEEAHVLAALKADSERTAELPAQFVQDFPRKF